MTGDRVTVRRTVDGRMVEAPGVVVHVGDGKVTVRTPHGDMTVTPAEVFPVIQITDLWT